MRDNQEYWYLDYLLFGEARTDNAYAGTTGAEVVPVETNALDASNPDIARDWNGYLNDIAHANVVIANIDRGKFIWEWRTILDHTDNLDIWQDQP